MTELNRSAQGAQAGCPALSRRSFVQATAAAAGVAVVASAGGFDFLWPEEAFADPASPVEEKVSYCDMCNHTPKCGIRAFVRENKIVRIESREDGYPNDPLCAKGMTSIQEIYDPHRLLHPMKRTNPNKGIDEDPGWEEITWEEAYDTIASKMQETKDAYGADAVFLYCGDPKEPRGAVNRLANLFGTTTYGNESSTCAYATMIAGALVTGIQGMGSNPSAASKSCLIWSLNPAWSLPNRFGKLIDLKKNGTKFVIVDPRVTPTVEALADVHLQLRPGTDGALALGIANCMIENGWYDAEFCETWGNGFEEFKEYVKEFTLEKTEEITWVPADKIKAAAEIWGTGKPGVPIYSASPVVHHTNGGYNMMAVNCVVAMQGAIDMAGGLTVGGGLPFDLFASTAEFNREDLYEEIKGNRYDLEDFPIWTKYVKQMQTNRWPEYAAEGKIKMMMMWGGNAMMWPQSGEYQDAIGSLEFAAAADYYYRPWTHNFCDILLPAAMCMERVAPLSVFGRKVFMRQPVVAPQGEAREDWQIAMELGCKLGFEEECFGGSVEEALNEVLRTAGCDFTYQDLLEHPEGIEVPATGENPEKKYETGGIRPDGQPGFNTPSGKIEFVSEVLKEAGFDYLPVYNEPNHSPVSTPEEFEKYPLILNTGSRVPMYTHSKQRNLPWLTQFMPEPIVRLNPADAEARGLVDGDKARIFNDFGEIEMTVEVTNLVLPGCVDMFHGWSQANVNLLIPREFDPITGYPPFKEGLCEVEKI